MKNYLLPILGIFLYFSIQAQQPTFTISEDKLSKQNQLFEIVADIDGQLIIHRAARVFFKEALLFVDKKTLQTVKEVDIVLNKPDDTGEYEGLSSGGFSKIKYWKGKLFLFFKSKQGAFCSELGLDGRLKDKPFYIADSDDLKTYMSGRLEFSPDNSHILFATSNGQQPYDKGYYKNKRDSLIYKVFNLDFELVNELEFTRNWELPFCSFVNNDGTIILIQDDKLTAKDILTDELKEIAFEKEAMSEKAYDEYGPIAYSVYRMSKFTNYSINELGDIIRVVHKYDEDRLKSINTSVIDYFNEEVNYEEKPFKLSLDEDYWEGIDFSKFISPGMKYTHRIEIEDGSAIEIYLVRDYNVDYPTHAIPIAYIAMKYNKIGVFEWAKPLPIPGQREYQDKQMPSYEPQYLPVFYSEETKEVFFLYRIHSSELKYPGAKFIEMRSYKYDDDLSYALLSLDVDGKIGKPIRADLSLGKSKFRYLAERYHFVADYVTISNETKIIFHGEALTKEGKKSNNRRVYKLTIPIKN